MAESGKCGSSGCSSRKGPVQPYLAADGGRDHWVAPAQHPNAVGCCLWGLADGARPLPGAASRPQPSSRAEIGVRDIILAH